MIETTSAILKERARLSPMLATDRMRRRKRATVWSLLGFLLVLGIGAVPARSQDTVNEFWPEVDAYVRFSPKYRLFFLAAKSVDRDTAQESGEFGPNLDITLKPFLQRRFSSLNPENQNYLTFRVGYRRLISQTGPNENRMVLEFTPRFPLPKAFLLADRNRLDLRWRDKFSVRYRNRLSLSKNLNVRTFEFSPYVRGEVFYDCAVAKWNRITYSGGVAVPFWRRLEIEPSFERQNISGSATNHVNGAGLTLSLYF